MTEPQQDNIIAINPPTLDMMTDDEILAKLDQVRANRLVLVLEYQKAQRVKAVAKHEQLVSKAGKLATRISKSIEKMDAEIAKIETYRHQIQALRIQALDVYGEEIPDTA